MGKKDKIEPTMIMVIGMHNHSNLPIVIVNSICEIQYLESIHKTGSGYRFRKICVNRMRELIDEYKVDMILFEKNKLFIDKIDKFPDPYVLHNILFSYSLQTTIEDNFYESVPYIMEIPQYEWRKRILNSSVRYAVDLFKAHILLKEYEKERLEEIDKHNYYETLCLSECVLHNEFLKEKYQINNQF